MKISIVTAVYNREASVAEAVASVQNQTHADVEHVIMDGGSTDGTLAVLARVLDARAILVSERDGGIYDALNKGMARATGDIIGLVHSDDFLADDRVLADVAAAFGPGVDAVYGDLDYVAKDEPTRIIRHWRSGPYSRARLGWGWMPPHPALFVRREVVERLGGYDTNLRIAADYDAILRWFGQGGITPAYIPRVLVKMRVGGASNRSLSAIWRKSREDWLALRRNRIGGVGALFWKNASKVRQFFV